VRKADNQQPSSADVTESGSLNLPEPSGPHGPVMGMLFYNLELLIRYSDYDQNNRLSIPDNNNSS
jgi:hypothetical protein